jgi:teichuronic acid biosynthesis glycosyltransferase TuaC
VSTSQLITLERSHAAADVLYLTNAWPRDDDPAWGVFVQRQIDSLIAAGVRADVMFLRGYASVGAYVEAARRVVAATWRRQYRLVHAHGGEAALVADLHHRAPLVVTYYGSDLLGRRGSGGRVTVAAKTARAAIRLQSRRPAATITQSRQMEAVLPESVRRRNAVIPNGVDTTLFAPLPKADARARLGWPRDRRVVLFAANPQLPVKRFELAMAACDVARSRGDEFDLLVVTGVPPDEMPVLMNAADCLLLTSISEGSPNVVKEAAMCNLPVVTTRVGDVADVLDGVEPSWLCAGTPGGLGAALAECLSRPRRSNGRALTTHLSLEAVGELILRLYRTVAPDAASIASATFAR